MHHDRSSLSNSSATPLIQYRSPVRSRGPSSNTWPAQRRGVDEPHYQPVCRFRAIDAAPKCAPQLLHVTSVRVMPKAWSFRSATARSDMGATNDGQPEPESNLSAELHTATRKQG